MAARRVPLKTGVELAVDEYGPDTGTPSVVLLHAWGEGRGSFERLVPLLPTDLRVVVPDLRGAGESSKPDTGYTVEDYAQDVTALVDALGAAPACLVGSSSGGYVAQQVAITHPDRVGGLVLVGSPVSLRGGGDPFGSLLAELDDPVTQAQVAALTDVVPLHREVPEEFLVHRRTEALSIPTRVWRDGYAGLRDAVPPTERGRIRAPSLIVWGGADELLPRADAQTLRDRIPGSELRVYDGAGHLVLWEAPERVAADVADFVRTRVRRSADR